MLARMGAAALHYPSPLLIEAEALRRNFYAFVKAAWPVIEPGTEFADNWHVGVICAHLQAITEGRIRRLIINLPPRGMKSSLVSVLWPAWEWCSDPTLRYLTSSRESDLSTRDALASRRLMTSAWYRARWGHVFELTGDQNAKTRYENDKRGYRITTSVGAGGTGEGGERIIYDDPHDMTKLFSDVQRQAALDWRDNTMSTRLNNQLRDAEVVIMQRGHQKDMTGHLLEKWDSSVAHVVIPIEFDGIRRKTVLGPYDPRTKVGELYWPERFPQSVVEQLKKDLGEYGTAGQLQQTPTPIGGGIIKRSWIKLWPVKERPIPQFRFVLQSYDTAFTVKTASDPTACGAFGVFSYKDKPAVMLMDAWDKKLTYPELRLVVKNDYRLRYGGAGKEHPNDPGKRVDLVLVEEKGSGISLMQDMRAQRLPVRGFNPGDADKATRVHAISPLIESGVLWVPESRKRPGEPASWAVPWLNQLISFGVGGSGSEHDDYVDITTQALLFMRNSGMIDAPLRDTDDIKEDDETESLAEYRAERGSQNPYMI